MNKILVFFSGVIFGAILWHGMVLHVAGPKPGEEFKIGWVLPDTGVLHVPFEIPPGGEVKFVIEPDESGELHARQVVPEPSPEPVERGT